VRRLAAALAFSSVLSGAPAAAAWDVDAFRVANTLEFETLSQEGESHWSTVWVVVLDDQVYLRLGDRAANRLQTNATGPIVEIRLGDETFDRVRAEPAPEMTEAVARAMGEKYWTDLLIRYFPHPLTVRLVPPPPPSTP